MKGTARILLIAVAALACCGRTTAAPRPAADPAAAPRLARTIVLDHGGARVTGRLDHFAYDPSTKRLYLAALGNGSVEVIDLDKGKHVASVPGLKEPQGVVFVPETAQVVVSCGGEGAVHAYDARTLKEVRHASVGADADNVRYVAGRVYVGYGSSRAGGIAVLDPKDLARVADFRLGAHPESFQLTPDAKRVFVNVPWGKTSGTEGSVVAGDLATGRVESTWTLKATRNFPMALDADHLRVFVATRKPAKLFCLDAGSGRVVGESACVPDADDIFIDPKTGHVLVVGGGSSGDGGIEVYSVGPQGKLARVANVATAPRARTGFLLLKRRALYVAVPARGGHPAEVREYLLPG